MRKILIMILAVFATSASAKGGGSSADNRSASWGSFMVGPGLSGNEGVMGRAALALHLGSLAAVEGYTFGTFNLDSTMNGQGARAMIFLGNSFYLAGGAEKRTIYRSGDVFSSQRTRDVFKDAGLTYTLGNRWTFSHFTIGVDWVGGFKREKLYGAVHETYRVDGPNTETKIAEEPYTASDYFKSDTRFLQLTLGVPF
jgi:hypothetical protein